MIVAGAPDVVKRIRVVRLVPVLDFGGIESILAVHAELHDRARFELRVCTFWNAGRTARQIEASGVQVDCLGVDPRVRNPRAPLALARYLARTQPDVLHASIPEADFHAGLVGRLAGARVVLTDEAGMPQRSAAVRRIYSLLHRNVSGIIAVSEALKSYLVEQEHAPAGRVRIIPTCGHVRFFESSKREYEAEARSFRFISVGRLVPEKNHAAIIDAIALLRRQGVDAELLICGDGPLAGELRARVGALGLQRFVQIEGFVQDLVAALRVADAYLLPSLSEGCSLSLIEALAIGLPAVASDIAGNHEVLRGCELSWFVAPNDVKGWAAAMAALVQMSAPGRAALGALARQIAARFSPQRHVAQLERLYLELLAERARSGGLLQRAFK